MKVISKKPAGVQRVYDIGVPKTHNFILANGLVSHNCFNKSHSIAYSLITYICAYLKANYPQEFFCALMSTRARSTQPKDWAVKAPQYIREAKLLGVDIQPPTVNASDVTFTIKEDGVYFGLNAIKGIGLGAARSIIRARGRKNFTDIYDFIRRINTTKVTTKTFESLIQAGAFDRMGYRRKDLLNNINNLYDWIKDSRFAIEREEQNKRRVVENKIIEDLIAKRNKLRKIKKAKTKRDLTPDEEEILENTLGLRLHKILEVNPVEQPEIKRYSSVNIDIEELMVQAEYIGCYIGTHPVTMIYPNHTRIAEAQEGEYQTFGGIVINVKEHIDRNGNKMAWITIGDGTGIIEGTVFASVFSKLKNRGAIPKLNSLIEMKGIVDQIDPQAKMRVFNLDIYRS